MQRLLQIESATLCWIQKRNMRTKSKVKIFDSHINSLSQAFLSHYGFFNIFPHFLLFWWT